MIRDIKNEFEGLAITPVALRQFGLLFAGLGAVWTGALYWKGHSPWPLPAALVPIFLLTGLLLPGALRHPYRLWMLMAFIMGWGMTRCMLLIAYFVLMTPAGVLMRFLGKDLLDERLDRQSVTYWKRHEPVPDRKRYWNQF